MWITTTAAFGAEWLGCDNQSIDQATVSAAFEGGLYRRTAYFFSQYPFSRNIASALAMAQEKICTKEKKTEQNAHQYKKNTAYGWTGFSAHVNEKNKMGTKN